MGTIEGGGADKGPLWALSRTEKCQVGISRCARFGLRDFDFGIVKASMIFEDLLVLSVLVHLQRCMFRVPYSTTVGVAYTFSHYVEYI